MSLTCRTSPTRSICRITWLFFAKQWKQGEPFVIEKQYMLPTGSLYGYPTAFPSFATRAVSQKEYLPSRLISASESRLKKDCASESGTEEFAYVASHDLREPLRMVNVYTQLLMKRHIGDIPEARQYADTIHQGVNRMEALIHDLLAFSRTIQPADEVEIGSADLSAALAEATSVLKDRIESSGAVIEHPNLPSIRGDTAQIAQVFQNLLSNAIKYQADGSRPW
jgi:signal transduction histidine kinase